jgi:hypothetical protein
MHAQCNPTNSAHPSGSLDAAATGFHRALDCRDTNIASCVTQLLSCSSCRSFSPAHAGQQKGVAGHENGTFMDTGTAMASMHVRRRQAYHFFARYGSKWTAQGPRWSPWLAGCSCALFHTRASLSTTSQPGYLLGISTCDELLGYCSRSRQWPAYNFPDLPLLWYLACDRLRHKGRKAPAEASPNSGDQAKSELGTLTAVPRRERLLCDQVRQNECPFSRFLVEGQGAPQPPDCLAARGRHGQS